MTVQPYLFFDGRAEEAIEFYRANLGAKVTMLARFQDSPPGTHSMQPPNYADKIMHAVLRIGDSTMLLADSTTGGDFKGFSMTVSTSDTGEAERVFAALSDGGNVRVPLGKTFFAPLFGWVTDRYGLSWMVLGQPRQND